MKAWIKYFLIIGLLIGGAIAYYGYQLIYTPNVSDNLENNIVEIESGTTFDQLASQLVDEKIIIDEESFRLVSKLMKYDTKKNISGRYKIQSGWNNRELVGLLRSGRQAPVNVTINAVRYISDMVGKVSQYIEPDSLTLLNYLLDPTNLEEWGYTKDNIMSLFIPNTYEFYWDTTPSQFVTKMKAEHDKYWAAKNRKQAISDLGLTEAETYALASIIEKETTNGSERKTISGVYHNRLKRGIALEADPTVVFSVGDFTIRRVLNKHLAVESPFNTYLNPGVPPGPIYMPTLASLDAAIFPEDHDYIFFCAKPGYDNEHSFASTLREHNRNAKIFHNWLNKQGIRK